MLAWAAAALLVQLGRAQSSRREGVQPLMAELVHRPACCWLRGTLGSELSRAAEGVTDAVDTARAAAALPQPDARDLALLSLIGSGVGHVYYFCEDIFPHTPAGGGFLAMLVDQPMQCRPRRL